MELSIPASPSRLAWLRRAARASLREVQDEVADDVVLALSEVATNAVLHGSSGGQPIQVVVHVNDDWVEASVLDHGPLCQPPVRQLELLNHWGAALLRGVIRRE
jgi:anti-sigma regulatory factor (Ser/Thr protein kinase)